MEKILFSVCYFHYKSLWHKIEIVKILAMNVRACPWKKTDIVTLVFFRPMLRVVWMVRGGLQLAGHPSRVAPRPTRQLHLSPIIRKEVQGLSEFFEVEKFRGEKTIRVGREWR